MNVMVGTGAVSFDDIVDALANIQRRMVLVRLLRNNPHGDRKITVTDSSSGEATVERPVAMHHTHLPRLVDHGFITWDEEANEVARGPNFDEIRPVLELLDEHRGKIPDDWV
jgi:hypothetical protein